MENYKEVGSINPTSHTNPKCPQECVDCGYLVGVRLLSEGEVLIKCSLPEIEEE